MANEDLTHAYDQLLTASPFQLIPIGQAILRIAAQIRATTNLKTPDAIHAATALSQPNVLFLTNDRQFRNVANLAVIVLDEVLAA
jgi:predicted nucleic acid-binding protein